MREAGRADVSGWPAGPTSLGGRPGRRLGV